MKYLIIILVLTSSVFAGRIQDLKSDLYGELRILFKNNQHLYTLEFNEAKKFSFLISLIDKAYASSNFDCIYGGWPAQTIQYNGKQYCHNAKSSDYYRHSYKCKKNEFTCPSVLFGKDVCVDYSTRKARLKAFDNCDDNKEEAEYLESFTSTDHVMMRDYIDIANSICDEGNKKSLKLNCKSVNEKIKAYKDYFVQNRVISGETSKGSKKKVSSTGMKSDEECINCIDKEVNAIKPDVDEIEDLSPKLLYQHIKDDFRKSELCHPNSQYSDEQIKNHSLMAVDYFLNFCKQKWGANFSSSIAKNCKDATDELIDILELSDSEKEVMLTYIAKMNTPGSTINDEARLKVAFKKEVLKRYNKEFAKKISKYAYLDGNVLTVEDNKITCPFPSEDAFLKAYKGYSNLKSKGKVKNNKLTIADYTMPSNNRRMFTIDMNTNKVIHNTWVAHGSGTQSTLSMSSEDGSNPRFSNTPETNLSSDGFVITGGKGYGDMYGSNLILNGVDKRNKNMRARAIILHGDQNIGGSYQAMVYDQEYDKEKVKILEETNIETNNLVELRKAGNAPTSYIYPKIPQTYGCLGVPNHQALNTKTGQKESQLGMLRDQISNGSVIFSYSGENQTSDYY